MAIEMSPHLIFRTHQFAITPGDDEETNPGIFGKSLAHAVYKHLREKGHEAEPAEAEDYGWVVQVKQVAGGEVRVVCMAQGDDEDMEWRIFVTRNLGMMDKLRGRGPEVAKSVADVYAVVHDWIRSQPGTRDLEVDE